MNIYIYTHDHLQIKDDFTKTKHLTAFDLGNPEISGFFHAKISISTNEMPRLGGNSPGIPNSKTLVWKNSTFLAGGFNPFEKYAPQIRSFPQGSE